MSLCPVCGRIYCDHTPSQRGQTLQEMERPLTAEELRAWRNNPSDSPAKIRVAQKHAHDPVPSPEKENTDA